MNICIDARLIGPRHTGIGRYVENLTHQLVKQNPTDHFVLLKPTNITFKSSYSNLTLVNSSIKHYSLSEQIRLPSVFKEIKADLYHFPHFSHPLIFNRPFVVTIHDLLWHETKDPKATTLSPLMHKIKTLGYHRVVKHAVLNSKAIITPSIYVKQQVLKFYPFVNPAKINVIYEGVAEGLNPYKTSIGDYLIYVGSCYPHKNLKFLISSLNLYNQQTTKPLKLKLVSSRSVFLKDLTAWVKQRQFESLVDFLGFLPDQDLSKLIQSSIALVMPSLSEGFGLPGLEAMALNTPVLSSTSAALPEVYGDAALYFDPQKVDSFIQKLTLLVADNKLRQTLVNKGQQRSNQFSWGKAATETMAVYKNI